MKKIYICGDSFAVRDPEYGDCWVDHLERSIASRAEIRVLARVAASNMHIALQIDRAIEQQADFVIWLATSSVRHEAQLAETGADMLDDFVDPARSAQGGLANYSLSFLDNDLIFTTEQKNFLVRYLVEYVNLPVEIYRNELMIDAIHTRMSRAGIPYLFDQGGFEHASFQPQKTYDWPNRSAVCLWDFVPAKMPLRPYFHITDADRHKHIAEYYQCQITPYL